MEDSPARDPESGPSRRPSSFRLRAAQSTPTADPPASSSFTPLGGSGRGRHRASSHLHSPYARPSPSRAPDSGDLDQLESGSPKGARTPATATTRARAGEVAKPPSTLRKLSSWLFGARGGADPEAAAEEQPDDHQRDDMDEPIRPSASVTDLRDRSRLPPSNLRHSTTLPSLSSLANAPGPSSPFVGPGAVPAINGDPTPPPPRHRSPSPTRRSSHATLNITPAPPRPPSPDRIVIPGGFNRHEPSRSRVPSPLALGDARMRDPSPVFRRPPPASASLLPHSATSSSLLNPSPIAPLSGRSGSPFLNRSGGSPFHRTGSPFRAGSQQPLLGGRNPSGLGHSSSLPFLSGAADGPAFSSSSRRRGVSPLGRAIGSGLRMTDSRSPERGTPVGSGGLLGTKREWRDMSISPPRSGGGTSVFGGLGGGAGSTGVFGSPAAKRNRIFTGDGPGEGFLTEEQIERKKKEEELERRKREGMPFASNAAERMLEALTQTQSPAANARKMMMPIKTPAPSANHVSARSALDELNSLSSLTSRFHPDDLKPKRTIAPATRNEQYRREELAEMKKGRLKREMMRARAEEEERKKRESERKEKYEMAERRAAEKEREREKGDEMDEDEAGDRTVTEGQPERVLRRSTRRSKSVSIEPAAVSPSKASAKKGKASPTKTGKGKQRTATPSTTRASSVSMDDDTPKRTTRASAKASTTTSSRRATRAATKSPEPEAAPLPRATRVRTRSASTEPDAPVAGKAKAKQTPASTRTRKIKSPSPIAEEPAMGEEETKATSSHAPAVTFAEPAPPPFAKSRSSSLRPGRTFSSRRHASSRVFSAREEDMTDNDDDAQAPPPNPAFDKIKIDLSNVVFPSSFKSGSVPATAPSQTPTPTPAPMPAFSLTEAKNKDKGGLLALPAPEDEGKTEKPSFGGFHPLNAEKSTSTLTTSGSGAGFFGSQPSASQDDTTKSPFGGFGASSLPPATSVFGASTPAPTFGSSGGFSFGQAVSKDAPAPSTTAPTSSVPTFSFTKPDNPPAAASSFFSGPPSASNSPAPSGATTPTGAFDFSRNPKDAQPPNFFDVKPTGSTTAPPKATSIFGGASAAADGDANKSTTINETKSNLFGNVNGFGSAANGFGASSGTEGPKGSAFSFGDQSKTEAKSIEAPKPLFAAPTPASTASGFSFSKPTESSAASSPSPFGGAATNGSATPGFSFGAATSAPATDTSKTAQSAFGFGSSTTAPGQPTASPFGGAFGSTAPAADKPAAAPSPFGASSAPSPFGGLKPAAGGFGSAAASLTNGTAEMAMDGSDASTPTLASTGGFGGFGASKPDFSFGSASNSAGAAPFVFGGSSQQSGTGTSVANGGASSGFSFGSSAPNAPSTSAFGALANAGTTPSFSFGGGSQTANGFGSAAPSPFGAATQAASATPAASSPGGALFTMGSGGDASGARQTKRLPNRRKR